MTLLTDPPASLLADPALWTSVEPTTAPVRLVLFAGPTLRSQQILQAHVGERGERQRVVYVEDTTQAVLACRQLAFDALVLEFESLTPTPALALSRLRPLLSCAILVLTRRADEIDEVIALEHGADDFLVCPISPRRLQARLNALIRRQARTDANERTPNGDSPPEPQCPSVAGWRLDDGARTLSHGLACVPLTPVQYMLMRTLMNQLGRVCSLRELSQRLHAIGADPDPANIPVYVHRLRRRLQAAGAHELRIAAVRGRGFVLQRPADDAAAPPAAAAAYQNLYCALT